jgi:hypothetical protein
MVDELPGLSIPEVARRTGLSESALRYFEDVSEAGRRTESPGRFGPGVAGYRPAPVRRAALGGVRRDGRRS